MYLMWQAVGSGVDSIPVALKQVNWDFVGKVTFNPKDPAENKVTLDSMHFSKSAIVPSKLPQLKDFAQDQDSFPWEEEDIKWGFALLLYQD
jgi:hypothetical protein